MVDIKSRDEFVNMLMQLLARRPDANVLVLVDSPSGLEILQTQQSFIWTFGVLEATSKMIDQRYRKAMESAESKLAEDQVGAEIQLAANSGNGEIN